MESMELDQTLRDSVTGLVSALGGFDYSQPDHPYVLGDDALGCLKDLKKWVKFYGSSGRLDALRCIADTNLVSLDICQILGQFKQGQEQDKVKLRLALNCCKFLIIIPFSFQQWNSLFSLLGKSKLNLINLINVSTKHH
jgi:replication fork protection complex subunit Tof1/Swi1